MQTKAFSIDSFLIAVKEQGNIKEAGEWIKVNHVHYWIYMYHSDFSEGKTGECVYSRKRTHCLEICRITGKYEFLKNNVLLFAFIWNQETKEQSVHICKKHSAMQKDGSTKVTR